MRRQDALFADDFLRGSDVLSQELPWGEDGREQRRRSVRETMVQEVGRPRRGTARPRGPICYYCIGRKANSLATNAWVWPPRALIVTSVNPAGSATPSRIGVPGVRSCGGSATPFTVNWICVLAGAIAWPPSARKENSVAGTANCTRTGLRPAESPGIVPTGCRKFTA